MVKFIKGIKFIIIIFPILITFLCPHGVNGSGFGISPPYVRNDKLVRGSYFEQNIVISRSEPDYEATAIIEIDTPAYGVPEFKDWLSFDPGEEVKLPQGQEQVTLKVKVNVPYDAVLGEYSGYLRIKFKQESYEGDITVTPGVRLDIGLTVTDEEIQDLEILNIDFKEYKVGDVLELEARIWNKGNIIDSPTKATIHITDLAQNEIGSFEALVSESIEPFSEEIIYLVFPDVNLDVGEYNCDVRIYKDEDSLFEDDSVIRVKVEEPTEKQGMLDILLIILGSVMIVSSIGVGLYIYLSGRKKTRKKSKKGKK